MLPLTASLIKVRRLPLGRGTSCSSFDLPTISLLTWPGTCDEQRPKVSHARIAIPAGTKPCGIGASWNKPVIVHERLRPFSRCVVSPGDVSVLYTRLIV